MLTKLGTWGSSCMSWPIPCPTNFSTTYIPWLLTYFSIKDATSDQVEHRAIARIERSKSLRGDVEQLLDLGSDLADRQRHRRVAAPAVDPAAGVDRDHVARAFAGDGDWESRGPPPRSRWHRYWPGRPASPWSSSDILERAGSRCVPGRSRPPPHPSRTVVTRARPSAGPESSALATTRPASRIRAISRGLFSLITAPVSAGRRRGSFSWSQRLLTRPV